MCDRINTFLVLSGLFRSDSDNIEGQGVIAL